MTEYTAKDNDFTEFDDNKWLSLEREDKNGTRYYISNRCPKCNGTGYLPEYDHVEGGICFLCDGTGVHETKIKVMTETYASKLAEKRMAKARKEAAEKNEKFLADNGFDKDGRAWIVLGNTYEIKDELKAAGAKYSRWLGWAFPFEQSKYDTLEISKDMEFTSHRTFDNIDMDEEEKEKWQNTLIVEDFAGRYEFNGTVDYRGWLKDAKYRRELEIKEAAGKMSEYVGEIGEKIEAAVTVVKIGSYETHYSYYGETIHVITMEDENGNQLVWKTGSAPEEIRTGAQVTVKGTVKAHSEYKGQKQTELTRCKAVSKVVKIEKNHPEASYEADKAIEDALRYWEA